MYKIDETLTFNLELMRDTVWLAFTFSLTEAEACAPKNSLLAPAELFATTLATTRYQFMT